MCENIRVGINNQISVRRVVFPRTSFPARNENNAKGQVFLEIVITHDLGLRGKI